jgi:uncharacterized membrane protein
MRWLFTNPARIDHDRIVAAIAAAEKGTSGRIRVFVARHRTKDPVAAAKRHFRKMGLGDAPGRSGVLILVAPRSRRFAVIGDEGVHARCGDAFWTELAAAMEGYFRRSEFTEGVVHGIERAGALLAGHFPPDGQPPRADP